MNKNRCSCSCHYNHEPSEGDFPTDVQHQKQHQAPSGADLMVEIATFKHNVLSTCLREQLELEKKLKSRQHVKYRGCWLVFDNAEFVTPTIVKDAKGMILGSPDGVLGGRITKRQRKQRSYANMTSKEKGLAKTKRTRIYKLYNTKKGFYNRNSV
jgi:hypothetical protein